MTRDQENEIISAVLGGDIDAFELLVKDNEKLVYNLALKMTGNSEDAYDMSQEAFIKAYNSLESFRGDSKFSSWLSRIVSNVCLDFLRSKKRRPAMSLSAEDDDGDDIQLEIADTTLSPETLLEKKMTRESVQRGLMTLPDDQRQILLLREIQGLSYGEISRVLGLEEGTVKSRISRARKKLCNFLINDGNIDEFLASNYTRGGELS